MGGADAGRRGRPRGRVGVDPARAGLHRRRPDRARRRPGRRRRPRRGRAPGRRPLRPRGAVRRGRAAVGALLLARRRAQRRPRADRGARRAGRSRARVRSRSRVSARDEGGGVYERALDLDGHRLTTARLCATVPSTIGAQRHVTSRVPCPLDAPATVPLDTRTLADGAHTLVAARAEDVAGNARTATARVVVDNLPPRPGTVTLAGDPSEALTAQPSGFSGEDMTYDYRWERCDDAGCTEIGGAVSRTYGVRPRDAGHRLRAVVIATDGGGSVRVSSQPSEPIPAPAAAPRATQPSRPSDRLARARPAPPPPHDRHLAHPRPHPRPSHRPRRPAARPHPRPDARAHRRPLARDHRRPHPATAGSRRSPASARPGRSGSPTARRGSRCG